MSFPRVEPFDVDNWNANYVFSIVITDLNPAAAGIIATDHATRSTEDLSSCGRVEADSTNSLKSDPIHVTGKPIEVQGASSKSVYPTHVFSVKHPDSGSGMVPAQNKGVTFNPVLRSDSGSTYPGGIEKLAEIRAATPRKPGFFMRNSAGEGVTEFGHTKDKEVWSHHDYGTDYKI